MLEPWGRGERRVISVTEKLRKYSRNRQMERQRQNFLKRKERKQEGKGERRDAVGTGKEVIDRRCRDSG